MLDLSLLEHDVNGVLQPDDGGDVHHGHGCLADEDVEIGTGCALQ